jgi:hypothetical protein
VNGRLVERQVALAAVALLAVLGGLALARSDAPDEPSPPPRALTVAVPWNQAAVAVYGPGFYGRTTECGIRLTRQTAGIGHPQLPCGARIVVSHGGREIEARVIDRRSFGSREEFALTQALAARLGVTGIELVRWRFASDTR